MYRYGAQFLGPDTVYMVANNGQFNIIQHSSFCSPGTDIPPQATLVFDALLVDIHNSKDNLTIENQEIPESCTRKSVSGDYVRYHYNGTYLNGVTFDTR